MVADEVQLPAQLSTLPEWKGDTGQAGGLGGGTLGSHVLSLPSLETSSSFGNPGKLIDPFPIRSPSL